MRRRCCRPRKRWHLASSLRSGTPSTIGDKWLVELGRCLDARGQRRADELRDGLDQIIDLEGFLEVGARAEAGGGLNRVIGRRNPPHWHAPATRAGAQPLDESRDVE